MKLSEIARICLDMYKSGVFEYDKHLQELVTDMLFNARYLRGNIYTVEFVPKRAPMTSLLLEVYIFDDDEVEGIDDLQTYDPEVQVDYMAGFNTHIPVSFLKWEKGDSPRMSRGIDEEPTGYALRLYRHLPEYHLTDLCIGSWYSEGA